LIASERFSIGRRVPEIPVIEVIHHHFLNKIRDGSGI
jgi:hypothetical protein